jgi:hypothetical protein
MEENKNQDIISIIKNNPLNRIVDKDRYNCKIIDKILDKFTSDQQKIFVTHFYCYLNYKKNEFILNLDDVWKFIGYSRIDPCKKVLVKKFKENIDYTISTGGVKNKKNLGGSGLNKEQIMLTIDCFKRLCMFANTKEAENIREYYVALEDIVEEIVEEETLILTNQLQHKKKVIEEQNKKLKLIQENIISLNKDEYSIYLIFVENNIVKFGRTNDIERRLDEHKSQFGGHIIVDYIWKTSDDRDIESEIKNHSIIKQYIISKKYKTNQTELIQLSEIFTIKQLIELVYKIIENFESNDTKKLNYRIVELEKENLEYKNKEKEEIIEENKKKLEKQEIGKLKSQEVVIRRKNVKFPFKAYNIITKEIKYFRHKNEAEKISGIKPGSLRNNYLNKDHQHYGFVYSDHDKPYWKPPVNFYFKQDAYQTTHMKMCKIINKETNEIMYANSADEGGYYVDIFTKNKEIIHSTASREFRGLCDSYIWNVKSKLKGLENYEFYKLESCGSWVFPDGKEQEIEEKISLKILVENGTHTYITLTLKEAQEYVKNNINKCPTEF